MHKQKKSFSNFFALSMTKFFRFIADTFFAKRYGHRAVVLETIAGVPGIENIKAPKIAIQYYSLSPKAKLSDLIKCVRADEMHHAEVNHSYADDFTNEDSPSSRTSNLSSIEKRKIA